VDDLQWLHRKIGEIHGPTRTLYTYERVGFFNNKNNNFINFNQFCQVCGQGIMDKRNEPNLAICQTVK